MNKHSVLICMLAAGTLGAGAAVLTPAQALSRLNTVQRAQSAASGQAPALVFSQLSGGSPACYVFSLGGDNNGFMVLSADDAAAPLLAYSDRGTFDVSDIPSNVAWWLGEYAREIEWARAHGATTRTEAPSRAFDQYQPIAPMVTTRWDQGAPYNNDCPTNSSGRHAYTGCVATAMAQVMKYHNYPETGQGSHTYGCTLDGSYVSLSVNFAEHTFDWDSMTNTYSTSSTAAQKAAVADLMYCCGVSVDMGYGTSSSGAQSSKIPGALIDYFKYDKACHSVERNYTAYDEWVQIIYNELQTVGPVLYGGQSNDGGHAFVCDGYDTDGFFHINWGWGGMSDGYFRLTALDPDSQGIGGASAGFNYDQHIVVGAQRAREGSKYVYTYVCGGNFTLDKSEVTLGRPVKVTSTGQNQNDRLFWNASSYPITGTVGLKAISANGNERYLAGSALNNVAMYSAIAEYSVTIPSDLAAGTYTLVPAWKVNNGTMQNILVRIPCVKAYKMVVANGKATLTAIEPDPQIAVTSLEAQAPVYAGKRAKFRVTFTNSTNDEFYDKVAAGLFAPGSDDYTAPAYAGNKEIVDVVGNSSIEYTYISGFGGATPGNYMLYFYNPSTYQRLGNGYNITVESAPTNNTVEVTNFRLKDNATVVTAPENMVFEFDATCTAGLFDGSLTIGIIQGSQTYWRTNFATPTMYLYQGESESLSALGSFPRASKGQTYKAYIYNGTNKSTAKELAGPVTFTVVDPSGITDVEADTADDAVLYNLQGIKVEGDPAPGHYISVSGGQAKHVIVR